MSTREADEVLVESIDASGERFAISLVHGNYETSMSLSAGELARLSAALLAALSTPPADDVREALAESLEDFMQDWYDRWAGPGETWVVRDMAASIVEKWLPAVRQSGTVTNATPSPDVQALIREARGQIASRTDITHPSYRSVRFMKRLVDALEDALGSGARPRGPVTDAEVEAAIKVWHRTKGTGQENWYLNPINRDRMRAALEAAREVHP